MAEGGVPKRMRLLNMVHNDEIWKDHVRHETISARQKWPETWGYLLDEYKTLNRVLEGLPDIPGSSPPSKSRGPTPSLAGLKLPEIPLRQRGFPRTTSQEIGWKSIQNGMNSEMVTRFPEQGRGKTTIYRKLKWPPDSLP